MKRTSRSGRAIRPSSMRNVPSRVIAGEQRLLLVHGVDVPEARHVEAALDRRGELVARRPRRRRRARGSSAPGRRASRRARARGRSTRAPPPARAAERVSCTTRVGDAVLDERQRRLRRRPRRRTRAAACAAKRGASARLIAGGGDPRAEPAVERAAALGVGEAVEGEAAERTRAAAPTASASSTTGYSPGGELGRLARAATCRGGAARDRARRRCSRGAAPAARREAAAPVGVAADDLHEGVGDASSRAHAGGRGDRRLARRRRSRCRTPRAPCSAAAANAAAQRARRRRPGRARAVAASKPSWLAVAGRGSGRPGWSPGRRARADARGRRGAPARAVARSASSSRRFVVAAPVWPSRTHEDVDVVSSTSVAWVGARAGEARAAASARAMTVTWRVAVGVARARARRARAARLDVTRRRPATSRKRAGAAPCETRMTWPGSPLPQFGRPHSRHSGAEQTASSEPQNRGVIPA